MRRLNSQTHPELKEISCSRRAVAYTKHARDRAKEKGIELFPSLVIAPGDVVEMEIADGRPTKIVIRQGMTTQVDRVMVLVPAADGWRCVTVWTNDKSDNHATLRRDRISA
jgi:hypothetical protein